MVIQWGGHPRTLGARLGANGVGGAGAVGTPMSHKCLSLKGNRKGKVCLGKGVGSSTTGCMVGEEQS